MRGARGLEADIPLGARGLAGPVQIIAATGEGLLPADGALRTDGDDATVLVRFTVDATAVALAPGESITLSGDRAELGAWAGDALPLYDDGTHGDAAPGDGTWATTVRLDRGGWIAWKLLHGVPGDGSWAGVEFDGDNRSAPVADPDGDGRIELEGTFGVR